MKNVFLFLRARIYLFLGKVGVYKDLSSDMLFLFDV